jgi:outer membrane protein insertion porin family
MRFIFKFVCSLCSIFIICLINTSFAFEPFVIRNINIEGLKKVSKEAVLQEINLKKGQTITEEQAQQIIKSLYKMNFFKDVQLEQEGNDLVVKLTERPVIGKLTLTGISSKEDVNKILKEHQVVEGLMYDSNAVARAERDIERHYLSKGKYGIRVENKVTLQERDRISLVIEIYEGEEAKIKQIKIIGNTKFKEKELLKQFYHGKTNWLSWYTKNDRYFKEKLDADLEVLQSYYMDRGFVNFQIESTQVSLTADKKHVYITISIIEGDQYTFDTISLSGNFVGLNSEFEAIIAENIKSKDLFSRKILLEIKKQIEDNLADIGYSKAEARLNFEINEAKHLVNINISVQPNQKIMVRRIAISGNYVTQDLVLRRMLPQFEGTWISNKDIQEGKQQFLRYGYASKVDVQTNPVAGTLDQVDLEYKIEEQRTMQVHAGISYSGAEGFGYNVGADIKNFVGTGKDVGFLFDNSKVSTGYSFNYYNPYFTVDGIGLGWDVYFRRNNLSKTSKIFEYSTDNIGGNIRASMPVSQYSAAYVGVGYNYTKLQVPYNPPIQIYDFTNKKGFKYPEYFFSIGWNYNSLDRYIFPTKGLTQKANFKQSIPMSKIKYYIVSYESSWFKPITKNYIFNFASDLAYGGKYGKDSFPFFRNFFVGGADSLRGFEEKSLGPLDSQKRPYGGNVLINFRNSVIFPVPFKGEMENVRPALFMDIGQVYDTYKISTHRSHAGLRYSIGLSVSINTPLGAPVVLSLAKPLNAKRNDSKETFAFTFSAGY